MLKLRKRNFLGADMSGKNSTIGGEAQPMSDFRRRSGQKQASSVSPSATTMGFAKRGLMAAGNGKPVKRLLGD